MGKMNQNRQIHQHAFWEPYYLPTGANPKQVYPTKPELMKHSAFGKPNVLKTYNRVPAFSHTFFISVVQLYCG
jgi:hypothetical protein